jgi:hypothetical protein
VSLRTLIDCPMPVTAPLVLNPLMAKMVERAGFTAGYLGGGATGYLKVALEANLNLTEMCQGAIDIGAVSSVPLILHSACGYGDPMHMHRTSGIVGRTNAMRAGTMDEALRRGEAYKKAGADLLLLSMVYEEHSATRSSPIRRRHCSSHIKRGRKSTRSSPTISIRRRKRNQIGIRSKKTCCPSSTSRSCSPSSGRRLKNDRLRT